MQEKENSTVHRVKSKTIFVPGAEFKLWAATGKTSTPQLGQDFLSQSFIPCSLHHLNTATLLAQRSFYHTAGQKPEGGRGKGNNWRKELLPPLAFVQF